MCHLTELYEDKGASKGMLVQAVLVLGNSLSYIHYWCFNLYYYSVFLERNSWVFQSMENMRPELSWRQSLGYTFLFCCCYFATIPSCSQRLFLALCSRISPGGLGGPCRVQGMEPGLHHARQSPYPSSCKVQCNTFLIWSFKFYAQEIKRSECPWHCSAYTNGILLPVKSLLDKQTSQDPGKGIIPSEASFSCVIGVWNKHFN